MLFLGEVFAMSSNSVSLLPVCRFYVFQRIQESRLIKLKNYIYALNFCFVCSRRRSNAYGSKANVKEKCSLKNNPKSHISYSNVNYSYLIFCSSCLELRNII